MLQGVNQYWFCVSQTGQYISQLMLLAHLVMLCATSHAVGALHEVDHKGFGTYYKGN